MQDRRRRDRVSEADNKGNQRMNAQLSTQGVYEQGNDDASKQVEAIEGSICCRFEALEDDPQEEVEDRRLARHVEQVLGQSISE